MVVSLSGIPLRLSTFIGRKTELAELRRLLPHTRLLTVLGPGGSGKTRLVTEFVSQQRAHFPDPPTMVDLSAVREDALVPDAVARAAAITLDAEDAGATLIRHIGPRRMLLVLDNCEHLLDAIGTFLPSLLAGCPGLTVIATSQARLNIDGERAWRLPSMQTPEIDGGLRDVETSDSVRLFVDRARAARSDFSLDPANTAAVIGICQRLEGSPLAIELASARITTLSPGEILARLEGSLRLLTGGSRDTHPRHRALRATIDWSHRLLTPQEQVLLRRLTVFAGDARIDAIEDVCDFPPLERSTTLDVLTGLVERSMVQAEPSAAATRYRLLATVREYAAEQLSATGETETTRDRHLDRYARLADAAWHRRLHRGAQDEHERLWHEIDDVRAALDWCASDPARQVALLSNLNYLWAIYAPAEGLRRLTAAIDNAEPGSYWWMRVGGSLLTTAGITGHGDASLVDPQLLFRAATALEDERVLAEIQLGLGFLAERHQADLAAARSFMRSAVDRYSRLGRGPDHAFALTSLASVERQLGNLGEARRLVTDAVKMGTEVEDAWRTVGAYFNLGWLELDELNPVKAEAAFLAGLDVASRGDLLSVAFQVEGVGCAIAAEDPGRAMTLFGAAAGIRDRLAIPVGSPWAQRLESGVASARGRLSQREAERASRAGAGLKLPAMLAMCRLRTGASRRARDGLSAREMEVAELVAAGMTSKAIAEKLFLSERTVETHVTHVMTKLGVNSRAQVATWVSQAH